MRTTLTLDEDVAALVERAREETGDPLKKVINDALRAGLSKRPGKKASPRFRTKTVSVGEMLIPNLDDIEDVLDAIEGDGRR